MELYLHGIRIRNRTLIMRFALCFLIIIEILCHDFLKDYNENIPTTWIYIITGLSIGLIPTLNKPSHSTLEIQSSQTSFRIPIILLLILSAIHYSKEIFSTISIDYRVADMLPVIDKMSLRYTQGKPVYSIIPEIWGGMQPIYLPAMWLPYSLSQIADIDLRWISLVGIIGGCSLVIMTIKKQYATPLNLITIGIPLFLLIHVITIYDHSLISISQEGIVICYYLLLCYAIILRKHWLIGVSIGLCLMSRYSLAPWVFGYGIFLLISKNYKPLRQVTISALATTILLLLSTGTLPHLKMILTMPQNYLASVQAEPGKYLHTIESNLGLAKFFSFEGLSTLHGAQLWVSILIPILCFSVYQFYKLKTSFNLYVLCVLKLSLVVFYNLLIIPYPYLFYTSTFVSIGVLAGYIVTRHQAVHPNSLLASN